MKNRRAFAGLNQIGPKRYSLHGEIFHWEDHKPWGLKALQASSVAHRKKPVTLAQLPAQEEAK